VTYEEREQVVEVLRCSADRFMTCRQVVDELEMSDDVAHKAARAWHDVACEVVGNDWHVNYVRDCLEAALRVEKGWDP